MPRVKRGTIANKTRRNKLKLVKGYRFGRSTKERMANTAIRKAGQHAFAHRRDKKNDFRKLWNVRLNSALRMIDLTYSKFIGAMTAKGITLNRKVLSEIAAKNPETLKRITETVMK